MTVIGTASGVAGEFVQRYTIAMLLAISLGCVGCAGSPSSYGPSARSAASTSNTPSPIPVPRDKPAYKHVVSGTIIVRRGDTVYGLARRYGVSPRQIIDANGLASPFHLEVGQRLILPRGRSYVVKKGDTVYGISRRFGVDMSELTRVNRLARPYTLEVGQKLTLPRQTRAATQVASSSASNRNTSSKKATTPPPPRSRNGFSWPIKGNILSHYGAKRGGLHNDGINIAASTGAPVKATDSGTVVYVGNELRGFGNLILIRHAGGWVSAYGHNSEILVSRGQMIKKGQVIAKVGSSGNVPKPQLHFELRKGSTAVDPLKYLPVA